MDQGSSVTQAGPKSAVSSRARWLGPVFALIGVVGGIVAGTCVAIGLRLVGLDLPAAMVGPRQCTTWSCASKAYSDYNSFTGFEILILAIFFGWAWYRTLSNRFIGRKAPDNRPFLERLPSFVRHPSPLGLVIGWVVAVFTAIGYPVAIYMTWRFYVERRDAASKTCPRCAEKVKAAALVCRHCGLVFEAGSNQQPTPTAA